MSRLPIAGIAIRVDGDRMPNETLSIGIAGDIFVLSTTVPSVGLTIHSTYHGHEGIETVVVRLTFAPGNPRSTTTLIPRGDLPVAHARERCLVDHLAHVRDTLEELLDSPVSIDVPDAALDVVL